MADPNLGTFTKLPRGHEGIPRLRGRQSILFPMLLAFTLAAPALRLSPLFSDGAVLQRGMDLPVWGLAKPGATVRATLAGQSASAVAGADGRWTVRFKALRGAGPFALNARSGGETVGAKDLLAGEVWLAAGQSNMELPEARADDYARAQAEASPGVRFFTVEKAASGTPRGEVRGRWVAASAGTVGAFSAVALSFAREVSGRLGVPVGVVQATWGGTPAAAWASREALLSDPALRPLVDEYDAAQGDFPAAQAAYRKAMADFVEFKHAGGNEGFLRDWQLAETRDDDWTAVPAGTPFPEAFDGAGWYRKAFDVPAEWVGKPLTLSLGAVGGYETTYFDGIRVGRRGYEGGPADASETRRYRIAPGIVRAGRNVVAVRVFDAGGPGGTLGPAGEMTLALADGSAALPLGGEWRFRIERALDPKTQVPARPVGPGNPNVPAALFNGMVAPLAPLAMRGALWYQGEADVANAGRYAALLRALVTDWRARWGEGDFPFLAVALAGYAPPGSTGGESAWAALREAQTGLLDLPNAGLAQAIDLGERDDIHPRRKREVGRRLALLARAKAYGEPVVYEGPRFLSWSSAGPEARVEFRNGALATSDGAAPRGFRLRGEDGVWRAAAGRVEGSTVFLRAEGTAAPRAVRYAWDDAPDANLTNRAGLPAVPFRTDAAP